MHPYTPPPTPRFPWLIAVVAALAVAGLVGWWYFQQTPAPTSLESVPTLAAEAPALVAEPTAAAITEPPAIENPIEPPEATAGSEAEPLPQLADADSFVNAQLNSLLGRKNVLSFLQADGFVRRVVATVDNLSRSHAAPMIWPINPTPQRFTTQRDGRGVDTIHPDNSQRYAPLVGLVESINTTQAAGLYRQLYPLFQQAYEELGFPGKYFNDRLVQVLDHLIETPIHAEPLVVTLVDVKGEVPSLRPWVRYEFADPVLQSLSAGRKMLLRTGPDNQRRLQAKLKAIRQAVAKQP